MVYIKDTAGGIFFADLCTQFRIFLKCISVILTLSCVNKSSLIRIHVFEMHERNVDVQSGCHVRPCRGGLYEGRRVGIA